jgi:D-beta-D-heptose 7-phosphate kinase/D-beta-D-heptose 1-phosphate adenosyltransferase
MNINVPPRPRIAVLGDLVLDQYTFGDISRISPEAPVPVLEVKRREQRLGGSGNVVLNLMALECECITFGRIGKDLFGKVLRSELESCQAETHHLLEADLPTITKNRMVARNQQVIRVDEECIQHMNEEEEEGVIEAFMKEVEGLSAVVLSDYGKGFLSDRLLKAVIQICNEKSIKMIVDPKGYDFSKYRGATTITPNFKEAQLAAPRSRTLKEIAENLLEQAELDFLLLTRSEEGISHFEIKDGDLKHEHYPVQVQEVTDVTGAGDTVVAVVALGLALNWEPKTICKACNLAAGYVVGHFGAASIPRAHLSELMKEQA